jgi:hypothetical protein
MPAESPLVRKRRLKMVGNSGKSSAAVSDYLRISDRRATRASCDPGMVAGNREKQHYHADLELADVATGEGTQKWIPHTSGIIERYLPAQVAPMRAAHQRHRDIDFAAINRIHVPVALVSMLLVAAIVATAIRRRRLDDLALLAATVSLALLGNAFVCEVISGRMTAMARGWSGSRPSWC